MPTTSRCRRPLNRRFSNGVSFGVNYVLGKAMGTSSTDFPAGNNTYNPQRHRDAAHRQRGEPAQGELHAAQHRPASYAGGQLRVAAAECRSRQQGPGRRDSRLAVSGVYRAGSGAPYTVTYNIPGISPYTLTGHAASRERPHRDHRRSGFGLQRRPVPAVQPERVHDAEAEQRRPRIGHQLSQLSAAVHARPLARALHPLRRQSPAGVPRRRVQRASTTSPSRREQQRCRCAAWRTRRRPTCRATRPAISSTPTGSARSPRWHPPVRFS